MNTLEIINHFYPDDTPLRRLLILHSQKVCDKALSILDHARLANLSSSFDSIDRQLVIDGAMLHDIGIVCTNAPGILCEGQEPYICHGTIGAEMLRRLDPQLEAIARICERHTGAGLTVRDIVDQQLPIVPVRDLLPETPEERLVCLADKFFSKSGNPAAEKDFGRVRRSMMKFGTYSLARFDALCEEFCIK